jgi:hypothetical protein
MLRFQRRFGLVVVGGGPAGLAVLLAAHKDGKLSDLLHRGVLIVEQTAHLGSGRIGDYAINSDSTGYTFVDPLRGGEEEALARILEDPVAHRIASAGAGAVPLRDAGKLLALVGKALHAIIRRHPRSAVLTCCTVDSAQLQADGDWHLLATDTTGGRLALRGENVVLATGGSQPSARLQQERVAGLPVMQRWGDRVMQSGEVIRVGGLASVAARLAGKAEPKVAILGGSTSAMSVAHALLHRMPEVRFGEGGVTLFHRRPLRVYYTSADEAIAEGYSEFGADDLCPVTRRVYRLGGLRLDSRELLMQARGIGGRPAEPRLKLHRLKAQDQEAIRLIDASNLVIAALGYRPNALRILDEDGADVALFAQTGPAAPLVDEGCRVMDRDRRPIPGLYGIGLAAGFVPHGKMGGEPSFTGQANGLWVWQNAVGSIIVDAVASRPAAKEGAWTTMAESSRYKNDPPVEQRIAPAAETGA